MNCLNCDKEYVGKRATSKFCSDRCRVKYNRDHPKDRITKVQMQVLYNSILEAVSQMGASNPIRPIKEAILDQVKQTPTNTTIRVIEEKEPTYQELLTGMVNIHFSDEKDEYAKKIHAVKNLSDKQRDTLLKSLYYKP